MPSSSNEYPTRTFSPAQTESANERWPSTSPERSTAPRKTLPHPVGVIFQPEPPCGQCSACDRIARSNFADVQIITSSTQSSKDPDAKAAQRRVMIGIELIKDLQSDAMLEPYEGRVKIFIIDEANRMSPDAANALLKTLEEPPSSVHIILTAPSAESVPETIASRCHLVRMRSVPPDVIADALIDRHSVPQTEAHTLAKMSMGSPGWAIAALNDPSLLDARKQSCLSHHRRYQSRSA